MHSKSLIAIVLVACILPGCGGSSRSSPSGAAGSGVDYYEDFAAANGSSWPVEWSPVVVSSVNADIQNNSGRLQTNMAGKVARVVSTTLNMTNFEAKITIRFGDYANQGIGFYGRQNGGYLTSTMPNGQGYVVYVEGNVRRDIGIWQEINGVESWITGDPDPLGVGNILNDTNYCVRYRVEQLNGTQTQIRARIWLQGDTEPGTWNVDLISTTTELQNQAGGFAVDLYNYSGTGSIYFDDIEITDLGP